LVQNVEFDKLGIPLVHGWLVDPQDRQAAAVFGTRCVMLFACLHVVVMLCLLVVFC
jgi:hypothetical protein